MVEEPQTVEERAKSYFGQYSERNYKEADELHDILINWKDSNKLNPKWLLSQLIKLHAELGYSFAMLASDYKAIIDLFDSKMNRIEAQEVRKARDELLAEFEKRKPAFKWFEQFEKHKPKTEGDDNLG